ncbi:DUF6241 domain-containing protein [Cytobacillus sp. FSL W7-1323]|uniref:DUF6241 domain-containing protein n=2 Tax=Bacillaceae TaxID=186817 RepID=UPI001CD345C2|nr:MULTISPECIES: DUF6241 domain-containing protein [Cytobacillus]MCA1024878.1 DUF6241 domain-containing protein [Cytobacillus kochii]MCM3323639.1 DUF6241 domain-containing protein [Cytobacillus kochii]MCM3346180.1 DUF6241 domain-containing protein [Cytobacillus kochii]MDM5206570.1 DUF6241 domain-containing protein [Cytobacillus kochii]MDQ0186838.1 hypothetical protein [Cytobacillus kochii]
MKKWLVIIIISGFVIISGGWFTASYLSNDSLSVANLQGDTSNKASRKASIDGDMNAYTENTGLSTNSTQSEVIDVMHKMTHQKVKASEKWGSVRMSEQAIEEVKKTIENNQFEHEEELLTILDKWSKGDFSNVDNDHNYFWSLQNGTIGKATGILSPEEEEAFIEKYFE